MLKKSIAAFYLIFFFQNCFAFDGLLQTSKRDEKFSSLLQSLDINATNVQLEYKVGTTSVGLKILQDKDYIAYWYPQENVSANSEGQVVTYYLGRFLKMSELVAPSEYYEVSGQALKTFVEYLKNDNEDKDDEWKQKSINDSLSAAQEHIKNKSAHPGALTLKVKHLFEPVELVNWQENKFRTEHAIAQLIRADQPQPSSTQILLLPDFYPEEQEINTSTELQLARDLSKIMVLDMLTGQRDRFSGGNLEARYDKKEDEPMVGRLRFFVRDNGGASLSEGDISAPEFTQYLSIVSRFDREQIQRVELLATLVEANPEALQKTLRIKSDLKLLKLRIKAVLHHVHEQVEKYGEDMAFFRNE